MKFIPRKSLMTLQRLMLITMVYFSAPVTAFAGVSVIVNTSVNIESISAQQLGRIYAMQIKNWNDKQSIKVFTYPANSKIHHQFVISQMKMQPHQLERLWNRLIFTGTGRAPNVVSSAQEMIEKVKNTPGAIGYIENNQYTDDVKVLVVGN